MDCAAFISSRYSTNREPIVSCASYVHRILPWQSPAMFMLLQLFAPYRQGGKCNQQLCLIFFLDYATTALGIHSSNLDCLAPTVFWKCLYPWSLVFLRVQPQPRDATNEPSAKSGPGAGCLGKQRMQLLLHASNVWLQIASQLPMQTITTSSFKHDSLKGSSWL